MKNGDGEKSSDHVVGGFLPWQGQQFDESVNLSPVSSRYSSCGESEFDRYCSANSVMGTPSMCSSVGPFREAESEFGSFRSLDGFSLGGSFERKIDDKKVPEFGRRIESSGTDIGLERRNGLGFGQGFVRSDGEVNRHDDFSGCMDFGEQSRVGGIPDLSTALDDGLYDEDGGGRVLKWDCATSRVMQSSDDYDGKLQKESAEVDQEIVSTSGVAMLSGDSHCSPSTERVDGCLVNTGTDMGCNMIDGGRCSDEGEASSRYEYSEGEDSSFGYGTGDEKQINLYDKRNIGYSEDKVRREENALLMNSSVAFGSDDWDDFMQETCANPITSMAQDDLWVQKQINGGSDADNLHSTSASNVGLQNICLPVQQEGAENILRNGSQVQDVNELTLDMGTCSTDGLLEFGDAGEDYMSAEKYISKISQPADLPQQCSERNVYVKEHDLLVEDLDIKAGSNIGENKTKDGHSCTSTKDKHRIVHSSKSINYEKTKQQLDSPSNESLSHLHSTLKEVSEVMVKESLEDQVSNSLQAQIIENRTTKEFPASNHPAPVEVSKLLLSFFKWLNYL